MSLTKTLNIIEFVIELNLLGKHVLSPAQRTALKVVFGLTLDDEE